MTYEELLAIARAHEGKTLETVAGRRFRVGIFRDSVVVTPESSGYPQSDGRAAGEKFVERYNRMGSLHPGHYARVTRNASYYVAVLLADSDRGAGGE